MNSEQVNRYFTEQARISGVDIKDLRRIKPADKIEWEDFEHNFNLILHEERNKGAVYA